MKLKNEEIYYIPNLVNQTSMGIDEFRIKDEECIGVLSYMLDQTDWCLIELMEQFPMFSEEEEIEKLMNFQFQYAKNAGVNPEYCYQYFGRKGNITHGIMVGLPIDYDFIPLKLTTTNFVKGDAVYQRREEIIYDKVDDLFIPQKIVEVEKNNGVVVQSNLHPKVLKKMRNYVYY